MVNLASIRPFRPKDPGPMIGPILLFGGSMAWIWWGFMFLPILFKLLGDLPKTIFLATWGLILALTVAILPFLMIVEGLRAITENARGKDES